MAVAVRTGRASVEPDRPSHHGDPRRAATGGGARPALATAALRIMRDVVRVGVVGVHGCRGRRSVTRALTADWRTSVASSLIRSGQALYIIGADPVSGLSLAPVSHWDVHGGPAAVELVLPRRAGGAIRYRLGDPSRPAEVLQLRWVGRPRAAVGGCLAAPARGRYGLAERVARQTVIGRGERAGRIVSPGGEIRRRPRRRPGRRRQSTPPIRWRRSDATSAPRRGQTLLVESQMSVADSPASAPRRDYQVARFGANPPRDLVELREHVTRDVGSACGIPACAPRQHGERASGARIVAAVCLDVGGRAVSSHRGASARTARRRGVD